MNIPGRVERYLRIFVGFGTLVVILSCFFSIIYMEPADPDWTFNWHLVTPAVHTVVAVLAIFLLIFPRDKILLMAVLSIECVFCIFIDFEYLSIMTLSLIVEILFAWGYLFKNGFKKISAIYGTYSILLLWIVRRGWDWYIYTIVIMLFSIGSNLFVYYLFKERLSYFMPQMTRLDGNELETDLPRQGEKLNLRERGLTDRQRLCTAYAVRDNMTYVRIAATMGISLSIVKREMAEVCRIFSVKNKDELYLLFIQFKVEYEI